jgi:FAD synthetase
MTTVMVFGTFDILHLGHINLFEQARRYGDKLIVVVGRDSIVQSIKGRSPLYTEKERAKLLKYIKLVDQVVLGDKKDMYAVIRKFKPDVLALGYDQFAFVDKLDRVINRYKLATKIVRLKPNKEHKFKSSKIKKHFAKTL